MKVAIALTKVNEQNGLTSKLAEPVIAEVADFEELQAGLQQKYGECTGLIMDNDQPERATGWVFRSKQGYPGNWWHVSIWAEVLGVKD